MEFEIAHDFPHPLELFERTLNHPELLERLRDLPYLGERKLLEHELSPDGKRERWSFKVTARYPIPDAALPYIGDAGPSWVENSEYDREAHCFRFETIPYFFQNRYTCSGTYSLIARGKDRMQRVIRGDLRIRILGIGGLVERFIVGKLREAYEQEYVRTLAFLRDFAARA